MRVDAEPLSAQTLAHWKGRVEAPVDDRRLVTPGVVHIGVGGFHRAHQAMYLDRLMSHGKALDWGICGVGVLPADRRMQRRDGAPRTVCTRWWSSIPTARTTPG